MKVTIPCVQMKTLTKLMRATSQHSSSFFCNITNATIVLGIYIMSIHDRYTNNRFTVDNRLFVFTIPTMRRRFVNNTKTSIINSKTSLIFCSSLLVIVEFVVFLSCIILCIFLSEQFSLLKSFFGIFISPNVYFELFFHLFSNNNKFFCYEIHCCNICEVFKDELFLFHLLYNFFVENIFFSNEYLHHTLLAFHYFLLSFI